MRAYLFANLLAIILLNTISAKASGVEVSNVRVVHKDTIGNTVWLMADISWQNSWRLDSAAAPGNYDAVWVFAKVKQPGTASHHLLWQESDLIVPFGFEAEIPPDETGVFLFKSETGFGPSDVTNLAINWNYGAYGFSDTSEFSVYFHAIEMVYIPEGSFVAGVPAGGLEQLAFIPTTISTGLAKTAPVGSSGIGGTPQGGYPSGQTPPAFNNFPNGYKALYCMKYELTQQQYAEFLNDITPAQSVARFQPLETFDKEPYRYHIFVDSINGNFVSENPYLPINVLSYHDGAAYADWSGLRPMTELEFEKICRGPQNAVAGVYPWGDSTVTNITYSIENAGLSNEIFTTLEYTAGNAMYKATKGTINGPVRSGIFAFSSILATQRATGATYYGVMEMGGNVLERCVTMYLTEGRSYKGTHGNGYLSETGFHTNTDWPTTGIVPLGISGRGGKWNTEKERMLVSDRSLVVNHLGSRVHNAGFRFVRTSYE